MGGIFYSEGGSYLCMNEATYQEMYGLYLTEDLWGSLFYDIALIIKCVADLNQQHIIIHER